MNLDECSAAASPVEHSEEKKRDENGKCFAAKRERERGQTNRHKLWRRVAVVAGTLRRSDADHSLQASHHYEASQKHFAHFDRLLLLGQVTCLQLLAAAANDTSRIRERISVRVSEGKWNCNYSPLSLSGAGSQMATNHLVLLPMFSS